MKVKIVAVVDADDFLQSYFYKNCKHNRKAGCKCCGECPFKLGIEQFEEVWREEPEEKGR